MAAKNREEEIKQVIRAINGLLRTVYDLAEGRSAHKWPEVVAAETLTASLETELAHSAPGARPLPRRVAKKAGVR